MRSSSRGGHDHPALGAGNAAVRLSPGSLFPAPEFPDQRPHPRSPSPHTTVEDHIAGQPEIWQSPKPEVASDELYPYRFCSGVHPAREHALRRWPSGWSGLRARRADFPVVDAADRTSVSGVWAADNLAYPQAQVVTSAGAGLAAAIAINADLVQQDTERAVDDLDNCGCAFPAAMMLDECPPFRLDADGTDPGHLSALPVGPPALQPTSAGSQP
jgi:hypothetical protein